MAYRYNENTMTDTKQPEALRLADAMERFTKSSHWWTDGEPIHIAVAAELRSLHTENDTLRAGYDAARLEIASLQAQAQQCGAGAGCCAQAARIEALEAQLEAVGGVQRIAGPDTTPAAIGTESECIMFEQWLASEQPAGCVSDMWQGWLAGAALAAPAQPVAWALQWPDDSRLNLSTVFDTQLEATDYRESCSDGVVVVPLYTTPQQAAHLAAKWQVVPRQLTQDMAEAAKFVDGRLSVFKYADAYRAMLYAAPQPAAQAQDDAVVQAVAVEREACAQLAAQTVCDLHIPTGVKIYGARAAKAIRARGTDAS